MHLCVSLAASRRRSSSASLVFGDTHACMSPIAYSGIASPEPPNSFGKSFSFGRPSFIGSTVSA